MQHDDVLKKSNFDLLTPSQGSGGGGGGGGWGWGGCGQNICYYVASFGILFNLISNMAMFLKKLNFVLLTPTAGSKGLGRGVSANICYDAAASGDSL